MPVRYSTLAGATTDIASWVAFPDSSTYKVNFGSTIPSSGVTKLFFICPESNTFSITVYNSSNTSIGSATTSLGRAVITLTGTPSFFMANCSAGTTPTVLSYIDVTNESATTTAATLYTFTNSQTFNTTGTGYAVALGGGGGGSNGGNSGGGGGGAGSFGKLNTLTSFNGSVSVTIGARGNAGGPGNAGGTTSVGNVLNATGGNAGAVGGNDYASGGNGGTGGATGGKGDGTSPATSGGVATVGANSSISVNASTGAGGGGGSLSASTTGGSGGAGNLGSGGNGANGGNSGNNANGGNGYGAGGGGGGGNSPGVAGAGSAGVAYVLLFGS